ncbi:MAG: succinate dehydrogenase, hydrophobic membrane anchor protein [Hyphomicrobiaceae bacterium]
MSAPLHPNPSPTAARIRTPLARARGLGSAKSGTDHFWLMRVTAVANVVLAIWLTIRLVGLVGADYAAVKSALGNPAVGIPLLLFIISGMMHMRLGMESIIEDYVHTEGCKVVALMLNTFFVLVVGLACVYAVLKLTFGV